MVFENGDVFIEPYSDSTPYIYCIDYVKSVLFYDYVRNMVNEYMQEPETGYYVSDQDYLQYMNLNSIDYNELLNAYATGDTNLLYITFDIIN